MTSYLKFFHFFSISEIKTTKIYKNNLLFLINYIKIQIIYVLKKKNVMFYVQVLEQNDEHFLNGKRHPYVENTFWYSLFRFQNKKFIHLLLTGLKYFQLSWEYEEELFFEILNILLLVFKSW